MHLLTKANSNLPAEWISEEFSKEWSTFDSPKNSSTFDSPKNSAIFIKVTAERCTFGVLWILDPLKSLHGMVMLCVEAISFTESHRQSYGRLSLRKKRRGEKTSFPFMVEPTGMLKMMSLEPSHLFLEKRSILSVTNIWSEIKNGGEKKFA